jgi:hypothetical protein
VKLLSIYEQLPQFFEAQEEQPEEEEACLRLSPELLKLHADISLLTSEDSHSGQLIELSLEVTISSNSFPQALHLNS